jgi:integrase
MKRMRSMVSLVKDYLSCRRKLGVELLREGSQLLNFAHFADRAQHTGPLTQDLAQSWACTSRSSQINRARRLAIVHRFAQYRRQFDPDTQIPQSGLLGRTTRRLTPNIYSAEEIKQLLAATRELKSKNGLRSATYEAFFGLVAAAGLRLSEAIHLKRCDVDLADGILTVRHTKYGKTRIVPLHPSTAQALRRYVRCRDQKIPAPGNEFFFLSSRGAALDSRTVEYTFDRLRKRLGWIGRGSYSFPRIMDLRHSFICRRLMTWYKESANVDNAILALATYVGHTQVTDTYWYITGVPELMASAAQRFERLAPGGSK